MQQLQVVLVNLSGDILSKVESDLREYGGVVDAAFIDVDATIANYHVPPDQKRLFILELREEDDLLKLSRLADGYPEHPILVLSSMLESKAILGAVRSGASQFVPLPIKSEEFRDALDRLARRYGFRPNAGRLIVVTGVTEGCGGTTVALNLAHEANRLGSERTVLLEIGGRIGRLAVMIDSTPKYSSSDLLADIDSVDLDGFRRALTPLRDGLMVLPGAYQSLAGASPPVGSVLRLISLARRAADVVVVDVSGSFDEVFFAIMKAADDIILVAEQKVPSVHSLMLVRDAIVGHGAHGRRHYVINRYSSEIPGASLAEITKLLAEQHIHVCPVRSDGNAVMESINTGKSIREVAPHSPALEDMDKMLKEIAGGWLGTHGPVHRAGGFWRRLSAFFGG
ncbi:MAG: hypothetical protein C0467_22260 [Planctomycetaceae bacterium]|nr:hypothetical protein [Planctomycetaceae bacterium]